MASISRVLWNAKVDDPQAALRHALVMITRWAQGEEFNRPEDPDDIDDEVDASGEEEAQDESAETAESTDTEQATEATEAGEAADSGEAAEGAEESGASGDDGDGGEAAPEESADAADQTEPMTPGNHKFWDADGVPRKVRVKVYDDLDGFIAESWKKNTQETTVATRVRVVVHQGRIHVWIEHDADGAEYSAILAPGRAHLVRALLQVGTDPRLGSSEITTDVTVMGAEDAAKLEAEIFDTYRRLPLVVMAYRTDPPSQTHRRQSRELADRLVGLARVIGLTSPAQDEFKKLQPDMAVWGGAVRIYSVDNVSNPRAHRFFASHALTTGGMGLPASRVEQQSVNLYPHKVLREFREAVEAMAEPSLEDEIERLEEHCGQLESELDQLRRMLVECEEARNSLRGQVDRLTKAGTEAGWIDDVADLESAGPDGPDDTVSTMEEAILQAQVYLQDLLTIPDSAAHDIDKLDSTQLSSVWANTLWRGLQSLHRYARENLDGSFPGGFYLWCQNSGHTSIHPSKVAMKESDTVRQSQRLRHQRTFPCDSRVEEAEGGRVFMEAHLKISEGGGTLIPRVYFYDDLAGATKKIHIGFIGPHEYVSNTKT